MASPTIPPPMMQISVDCIGVSCQLSVVGCWEWAWAVYVIGDREEGIAFEPIKHPGC